MEKREPWEKKSTFSALSVYQRILLLLLLVMIAAFTGLAFWFQSHPGLVCIRPGGQKGPAGPVTGGGDRPLLRQAGRTERGVLRHRRHRQLPLGGGDLWPLSGEAGPHGPAPLRPGEFLAQRPDRGGGAPGGHGGLSGRLCLPRPDAERLLGQKSGVGGRYRL